MKRLTAILVIVLAVISNVTAASVLVNQLGYTCESKKLVYTTDGSSGFKVFNSQTDAEVFSGLFVANDTVDPLTGLVFYIGEFSDLTSEGTYYIKTDAENVSVTFSIADTIFNKLYNASLKGFYFQRCGSQLYMAHAGEYQHLRCHKFDGYFHETSGESGFKLSTGGWHDAGDFGKYVVNAGISVGTMLLAYEVFPERFYHDNIGIPESGNGVPDLLDEVRYELKWLLTMQHTNGGVFTKLTPEVFAGMIMPQLDESTRNIYQISSTATGDFAAMMAMAYRIYKNYDEVFANSCLEASLSAWQYLHEHPGIVPAGGFTNPTGTITGEYGDGNDRDERLWASVELYKSTGDIEYQNYFLLNIGSMNLFDGSLGWQNVKNLAFLSYIYSGIDGDEGTIETLSNSLIAYCDNLKLIAETNRLKLTLKNGDFYWGSNSFVLNNTIMLINAYNLTNEIKYYDLALAQLDYILGVNAHDISFITGVGEKSLLHPHHRQSEADNIEAPVPGLLSGGPNQYLSDPTLQSLFNSSTPPAMCFVDDVDSYASNEIAINWNSPLVFAAGYFNRYNILPVDDLKGSTIEKGFRLLPNYPNPFNGNTIIKFYLEYSMPVEFKVYDIQGKLVYSNSILANRGENSFKWSPESSGGRALSSGVYFYRFEGELSSPVDKLVFLK